jgi:hypothetical protein
MAQDPTEERGVNREDIIGHRNVAAAYQPTWGGSAELRDFLAKNPDADLRAILEKALIQLAALEDAVFAMAGGAAPTMREVA